MTGLGLLGLEGWRQSRKRASVLGGLLGVAGLAFVLTLGGGTSYARSSRALASKSSASSSLTLITEPKDGIGPILSAIRHARQQIDLVMYQNQGKRIDAALAAAHHRGVQVRVLLSRMYYGRGYYETDPYTHKRVFVPTPQQDNRPSYKYFKAHGVPARWTWTHFAYTHQKTMVVDGVAYIMTFNFTPQYYATSRDFGLIDTNSVDVQAIETTFDADWHKRHIASQNGADLVWSPGSRPALVKLIRSAHGWLDIYNEEMNSTRVESALEADARRGVNVRVTMTYSSDWKVAFEQLTKAGVHVHLYPVCATCLYIHAKMILTPRKVFLGSENFSENSMSDNRELGLITSDKPIRTSLARTFNQDYAGAKPFYP